MTTRICTTTGTKVVHGEPKVNMSDNAYKEGARDALQARKETDAQIFERGIEEGRRQERARFIALIDEMTLTNRRLQEIRASLTHSEGEKLKSEK